jgi:GT2 family glycosyltransferase
MLISKDCRAAIGDFDEKTFAIAYNDVDFCLRAGERGFRTVWTPFATLLHHESASRGSDETEPNNPRFLREQEALRDKAPRWQSRRSERACTSTSGATSGPAP